MSLESDFTLDGFRTAAEACETNAIVLGVSGDRGAGKTHLGGSATSQGKVAFQILDMRHHGVLPKFPMDRIVAAEYRFHVPPRAYTYSKESSDNPKPNDPDIKQAATVMRKEVNRFIDDFKRALDNVRTVVWDTEPELWEMFRGATFLNRFGRIAKVPQNAYGEVNAEFSHLIRMARDAGVNLVLLRYLKDEYANDKRTGKKIPAGFPAVTRLADVLVRMSENTNKPGEFVGEITKSGWSPELVKTKLDNPSFYDIASLCVPAIDWTPDEGGTEVDAEDDLDLEV